MTMPINGAGATGLEPALAQDKQASPPWGWGEALVATGCVACVIAALALPWARGDVAWKVLITNTDIELGTYSFKLLDNPWLAAALVAVAVLCAAGLFWRRRAATISIAASLLLLAGSVAYLISLIEDAFDFLGFYNNLMELVRSFPVVGPMVESAIRERLSISAFPHAGVFVFIISTLLILAGGLLIRKHNTFR
jgi:hypothetical protein